MNNQPSFDRGLLIPIGVGIFSLMGICVILVMGRLNASRAIVEEVPTATRFQYSLIGTEPAIAISTIEGLTIVPVTVSPAFRPPETIIVLPTNTTAPVVPIITLPALTTANTPTLTPTSASTAPFIAGTYDDVDSRLVYSGPWDAESGVPGAYQNTLHVSGTLGSSVTFRFIGQEVRVFFQAGPSLGTIRLTLDGTAYEMSEASTSTQTYEWVLPRVSSGTHTVTISHFGGGSVNLDSIIIPDVPLTPTNTTSTTTTTPNQ